MSGITAQTSGGIVGCEAGKSWMHREIRGARPSHLDLLSGKLIFYPASIAFLLTLLVPFSSFLTGGRGSTVWDSDERIRVSHSERASFHTEYGEWRDCLRHRERRWLLQGA
jgi:hypothetical protein